MDNHFGYEKREPDASQFSNNRNGKTIKEPIGELTMEVPRDKGEILTRNCTKEKTHS